MEKKIGIILTAMLVLNIVDGDFKEFSVLNIVKVILYVICFAMLIKRARKENK